MKSSASLSGAKARFVIAVAATLTFARALPFPLQRSWDDGRFLLDNPQVQQPSLWGLTTFFTQRHFEAYHPLHLLSYWLDVPWFGPNPLALHTTSLLLWIAALCVLHACLRELQLTAAAALMGTLLVGLHPVQVEAVSWATGRKDVLAMLFACASLLFHSRSRNAWDRLAWTSRVMFLLAALSKTTTLPLPLFALVLDTMLQRRSRRDAWLHATPSLVIAAGLGVVAWSTWQEHEMVRTTLGGALAAPWRWAGTLAHQLQTALWPSRVSPMYSTDSIAKVTLGSLLWPAALVAAVLGARRAGMQLVAAGLIGFVVLLLPASNIVAMYFPLQDRYLSLPLLGLGLASASLMDALTTKLRGYLPHAALALGCALLAARTVQYEAEWSSELRLWGHAATTQPDAQYAWLKLSAVRRDTGDHEGAIDAARALVQVAPNYRLAWAALLEAAALRDERMFGLSPSRAREHAHTFFTEIEHAEPLRTLASQLLSEGYLRALELPLAASLVMSPLPDAALESAARSQLKSGRRSVARFYLHRLRAAPTAPELAALYAEPYFSVLP